MKMAPVKSSAISALGYDPETKELHVTFAHGKTYRFIGVSPEKHKALEAAESPGRHFMTHIRHHHQHELV